MSSEKLAVKVGELDDRVVPATGLVTRGGSGALVVYARVMANR